MAWFLVGLTVFAIFMGSLTALLTVTVVKMNSNRGSYNIANDGQMIKVFSCLQSNLFIVLFTIFRDTLIIKEEGAKIMQML